MSNYYVNTPSGNDGNSGLTELLPWLTVNKVNISSFNAGDSVSFNKTCTWREQLTVPSSGSDGLPITFGAYGTGADPIISGASLVTGTWGNSTAVIVQDTLETGALSTSWTGTGGTAPAVDTESALTGTYGMHQDFAASGYASKTLPAGVKTIVFECNYRLNAETMANGDKTDLIYTWSSATNVYIWVFQHTDGKYYITASTGTSPAATFEIALQTTYAVKLEFCSNATTGYLKLSIDGDLKINTTGQNYNGADITTLRLGTGYQAAAKVDQYVDDVLISSVTLNVWSIALTTQPLIVAFNGVSGAKKTSAATCTTANDWYWASNILYVYSTSDPTTAFIAPGIEAGARDYCVKFDGRAYGVVDGVDITQANNSLVYWRNSDHLTIQNCTIHDGAKDGINTYLGNGAHLISANEIYYTGVSNTATGAGNGIHLTGGTASTIQKNYFHNIGGNSGDHPVYDETDSNIIKYNLFDDSLGECIAAGANNWVYSYNIFIGCDVGIGVRATFSGGLLYNNTFYNCISAGSPYCVIHYEGAGVTVKNNVFYGTGTAGIFNCDSYSGFTSDYNIAYALGSGNWGDWNDLAAWRTASGQDAHSSVADPSFTNAAGGDFTLQAGSPCIDVGVNLGTDYQMALAPGSTWP